MMDWEEKSWGRVWHFHQSARLWGSYLEMTPGTRSSWHYHVDKINFFALLSGLAVIEKEGAREVLHPGSTYTVTARVKHRFRVIEPSRMIELYTPLSPYVTVKYGDIVRFDEGGADDVQEARTLAGL